MDEKEAIILLAIGIPLLLVFAVIILISVFSRRKNKFLIAQASEKEKFNKELTNSEIEIREATLRHISWELHDNIGQLMTLSKIQVQMLGEKPDNLEEAIETIGTAINELRSLSKMINPEALRSMSLPESLTLELERFNRLKFIISTIDIVGTPVNFDSKREIIIFRILQEFFSNTIKHSKAKNLDVTLNYSDNGLTITAIDNGVGFNDDTLMTGIGLSNMKSRAKLINAEFNVTSESDQGTKLKLIYPFSANNIN